MTVSSPTRFGVWRVTETRKASWLRYFTAPRPSGGGDDKVTIGGVRAWSAGPLPLVRVCPHAGGGLWVDGFGRRLLCGSGLPGCRVPWAPAGMRCSPAHTPAAWPPWVVPFVSCAAQACLASVLWCVRYALSRDTVLLLSAR